MNDFLRRIATYVIAGVAFTFDKYQNLDKKHQAIIGVAIIVALIFIIT